MLSPTAAASGTIEVILFMTAVTLTAGDAAPAAFVATAVKLWISSQTAPIVKRQIPLASAVVLPSSVGPSNKLTTLSAAETPVNAS
jgi:hypothetical protein